jgi:hypothetical protein
MSRFESLRFEMSLFETLHFENMHPSGIRHSEGTTVSGWAILEVAEIRSAPTMESRR